MIIYNFNICHWLGQRFTNNPIAAAVEAVDIFASAGEAVVVAGLGGGLVGEVAAVVGVALASRAAGWGGGVGRRGQRPQAATGSASFGLDGLELFLPGDVGRVSDDLGVALPQQFGVDEGSVREVDVAEETAVPIRLGCIFNQNHTLPGDQLAVGLGRSGVKGVATFGGVYADVADAGGTAVHHYINRIAINYGLDNGRFPRRRGGWRMRGLAQREGLRTPSKIPSLSKSKSFFALSHPICYVNYL